MPESQRKAAMESTPEALAIRGETAQMVQDAIDGLPDTYRVVFVLREVEQMTTIETAECLGLSEEAVKTRGPVARAAARGPGAEDGGRGYERVCVYGGAARPHGRGRDGAHRRLNAASGRA